MPRGYGLVDPGLDARHAGLDFDDEVRCLSYLIKHMNDFMTLPEGVKFEVIAAQYTGGHTLPLVSI